MDTKLIEYIIAIAEEKSLSRAADRLFLTQPALSQRLKKLEAELGTPLFLRDKDGLTITDAGRVYVNGGRSVLKIKEDAYKQLSGMNQHNKNTIRLGCATSMALECVPVFRKAFPDVELITKNCNSPAAKESLIMGRMDIAVLLTSSLQHGTLDYLPLSKNEMYLALPASHPALSEDDPFQDGYECLSDDYFILNPPGYYSRDLEDQALKIMDIYPRVLCELSDHVSRRYMLNRSLGNGFLPDYAVRPEDTYRTYPLHPPISFYIAAAYPKSTTLSEPLKQLLKILLTIFDTPNPAK